MAKKTQGTSLFALIPGSAPIIARITCVTSITGLGAGARDQIDVTCLEDLTDRQLIDDAGCSLMLKGMVKEMCSSGRLTSLVGVSHSAL